MATNYNGLPVQTNEMTILEIRLSCRSDAALSAALEALQGALGEAESVSQPYPNRNNDGKRLYIKFIVPVQAK